MPASTACSLPDEQQQHYCEVLTCLHDHDIVINPAESVSKLSIWNFVTSCWLHWHQALESKVQVICDFPKPTTQHKLRESLGLVNFYHRFIPNCAAILVPLNSMLSSAQHSHSPLNWFPAAESAFTQLKDALADASLLEHPKPDAPTCIVIDTSDTAVRAVPRQCVGHDWSPIAFFSKKLQPNEQKVAAPENV